MRGSILPNGQVTFEVTINAKGKKTTFFFASVIISDLCTLHCNFDLPLIMPGGTLNYLM